MFKSKAFHPVAIAALGCFIIVAQSADARGYGGRMAGYSGMRSSGAQPMSASAPMYNRTFTGPHGSSATVNGNGAYVPNQGGFYNGTVNGTGARGGSFSDSGSGSYRTGVGGAATNQWSGTNARGGQGSGYEQGSYNAGSGTGSFNSGSSGTRSNGQQYGYNQTSNFTKGQGGTTDLNTDNKGDYQVNWGGGQKPVVSPANQ